MKLTDEQKQKVSAWIADGVKLSDIQSRLGSEFALSLTYMETRLLVDDLQLTPKDPEPEKAEATPDESLAAQPSPAETASPAIPDLSPSPDNAAAPAGAVAISVDALARPGTMVSGTVTFSDGKKAVWYLDQTGRLGVVPEEQGYRPPEGDVEVFQTQLDRELQKLGY